MSLKFMNVEAVKLLKTKDIRSRNLHISNVNSSKFMNVKGGKLRKNLRFKIGKTKTLNKKIEI